MSRRRAQLGDPPDRPEISDDDDSSDASSPATERRARSGLSAAEVVLRQLSHVQGIQGASLALRAQAILSAEIIQQRMGQLERVHSRDATFLVPDERSGVFSSTFDSSRESGGFAGDSLLDTTRGSASFSRSSATSARTDDLDEPSHGMAEVVMKELYEQIESVCDVLVTRGMVCKFVGADQQVVGRMSKDKNSLLFYLSRASLPASTVSTIAESLGCNHSTAGSIVRRTVPLLLASLRAYQQSGQQMQRPIEVDPAIIQIEGRNYAVHGAFVVNKNMLYSAVEIPATAMARARAAARVKKSLDNLEMYGDPHVVGLEIAYSEAQQNNIAKNIARAATEYHIGGRYVRDPDRPLRDIQHIIGDAVRMSLQ